MIVFKKVKFIDLLEPKIIVGLKKGYEYSFVPMENVETGKKNPRRIELKIFNGGGSRFADGDILFARITPCLQNKKIAKVKDLKEGIGFGSTEFFIFRAKKGFTNPDYLYYTTKLDDLINTAILSMVGASGRQRADIKSIYEYNLLVPDLPTQTRIASILSSYDDLIEKNEKRIKALEEMARLVFAEWFVKFKFPGHEKVKMVDANDTNFEKIPEGWEVTKIGKVLSKIESGSRPKGGINPDERGVPSIGAENINGLGVYDYSKEKFVSKEFFEKMRQGHVQNGDVLLYKDGAHIGRKTMFGNGFPHEQCSINEHVFILRTNKHCSQAFLYFWLDQPAMTQAIRNLNANAAQPGINQEGVKNLLIILPPKKILDSFDEKMNSILGLIFFLAKRNRILSQIRDLLIPQLVTGRRELKKYD